MSCLPGDSISIQFSSADATTAAAVVLYDANGGVRTLAANERLLIDTLTGTLAAAVTLAEVFTDDGDGNVEAGERIASFGANSGCFDGGAEGYPAEVGQTPKVKAAGAGQVTVTGTGRIVKSGSNGQRGTWKEAQVPS